MSVSHIYHQQMSPYGRWREMRGANRKPSTPIQCDTYDQMWILKEQMSVPLPMQVTDLNNPELSKCGADREVCNKMSHGYVLWLIEDEVDPLI